MLNSGDNSAHYCYKCNSYQ